MKKAMKFANWWFVSMSFVSWVVIETVCVYYLMQIVGVIPKT
jgi:hypothetical protein